MILFILPVILGILIGFLFRGKISNFRQVNWLTFIPLLLGLIIQIMMHTNWYLTSSLYSFSIIIFFVSYALLFVTIILNTKYKFMILVAAGVVLDFIIIFLNGGKMPVSATIINAMPSTPFVEAIINNANPLYQTLYENQFLTVLGIIFPLPFPEYTSIINMVSGFSIGMFITFFGIGGFVIALMVSSRQTEDAKSESDLEEDIFIAAAANSIEEKTGESIDPTTDLNELYDELANKYFDDSGNVTQIYEPVSQIDTSGLSVENDITYDVMSMLPENNVVNGEKIFYRYNDKLRHFTHIHNGLAPGVYDDIKNTEKHVSPEFLADATIVLDATVAGTINAEDNQTLSEGKTAVFTPLTEGLENGESLDALHALNEEINPVPVTNSDNSPTINVSTNFLNEEIARTEQTDTQNAVEAEETTNETETTEDTVENLQNDLDHLLDSVLDEETENLSNDTIETDDTLLFDENGKEIPENEENISDTYRCEPDSTTQISDNEFTNTAINTAAAAAVMASWGSKKNDLDESILNLERKLASDDEEPDENFSDIAEAEINDKSAIVMVSEEVEKTQAVENEINYLLDSMLDEESTSPIVAENTAGTALSTDSEDDPPTDVIEKQESADEEISEPVASENPAPESVTEKELELVSDEISVTEDVPEENIEMLSDSDENEKTDTTSKYIIKEGRIVKNENYVTSQEIKAKKIRSDESTMKQIWQQSNAAYKDKIKHKSESKQTQDQDILNLNMRTNVTEQTDSQVTDNENKGNESTFTDTEVSQSPSEEKEGYELVTIDIAGTPIKFWQKIKNEDM